MDFREHTVLGKTALRVSRLGLSSSYGVPASSVEEAYHEHGINFFYWGSIRRPQFGRAIRNLVRTEREKIVVLLQSYDRTGILLPRTYERGLRRLDLEYADILLLGWYNSMPPKRVLEAAAKLKEQGKARYLALSGHHRPFFGELARRPDNPIDVFMVRYSAAHRGAETDIFPHLSQNVDERPGIIAYTATRWGKLLKANKMPEGERPLTASECYRFPLSSPHVDVCMTGPANAQQFAEALPVLDGGPLSEAELARVHRIGDFAHAH